MVVVVVVILAKIKTKPTMFSSGQPIKVGVVVALSGYASNWGEGELRALHIAIDDYKDKIKLPIQLIVEDTKSNGIGTVNATSKLTDVDHVQVIFGPTWGDSFQGGHPITDKAKVTEITPSAALETIKDNKFSYLFSTWWPQENEVKSLLDFMSNAGETKISVISDQDPFNLQFTNDFIAQAEAMGKNGMIGSKTIIPIGVKEFRTYIAKIKAENPSAIFIQLQDTSSRGPFMKELKEQNVKAQVYGTADAEDSDNIKKFPGFFDGLFYAFPSYSDDLSYSVLLKKLMAKYGSNVSQGPSFVNAYNAAIMLLEVLKNGARTGTEIRDALTKIHVPGVGIKELSFDSKHQIKNVKYIIKTVKNNQFVEIK